MSRFGQIAGTLLTTALVSQASASAIGDLPTYRAVYRVDRDGKNSGTAEWSLTYDAERDVYCFVSSLSVKGVLRLALPEPILERAVFRYENGAIAPSEFFYEDGTRRGEESFYTAFDWPKNRAITIARGQRSDLEVQPGVLDRATMYVALMRNLASGEAPRTYRLADDDTIKTYSYSRNGQETISTSVGTFATEVLAQQREGSSRRLLLWLAPELGFLPVRMEQHENGRPDSISVLEHVEIDGIAEP